MGRPQRCYKKPPPYVTYSERFAQAPPVTSTTTTTTTVDPLSSFIEIPESGGFCPTLYNPLAPPTTISTTESVQECRTNNISNPNSYYIEYKRCENCDDSKIVRKIKGNSQLCVHGDVKLIDKEDYSTRISIDEECPADLNDLENVHVFALKYSTHECSPNYLLGYDAVIWKITFDMISIKNFLQSVHPNSSIVYQWDYYLVKTDLDITTIEQPYSPTIQLACASDYDIDLYEEIDQNSCEWTRIAKTTGSKITIGSTGFGIPVYSYMENSQLVNDLYLVRCIILVDGKPTYTTNNILRLGPDCPEC